MFSLVRCGFYLLFTSFLKKYRHIHVLVLVVKKGLVVLRVLLTQQNLLFEHCTEINFITCI